MTKALNVELPSQFTAINLKMDSQATDALDQLTNLETEMKRVGDD
jgi:hypothetical protein